MRIKPQGKPMRSLNVVLNKLGVLSGVMGVECGHKCVLPLFIQSELHDQYGWILEC